jgi:hypothetical protein
MTATEPVPRTCSIRLRFSMGRYHQWPPTKRETIHSISLVCAIFWTSPRPSSKSCSILSETCPFIIASCWTGPCSCGRPLPTTAERSRRHSSSSSSSHWLQTATTEDSVGFFLSSGSLDASTWCLRHSRPYICPRTRYTLEKGRSAAQLVQGSVP